MNIIAGYEPARRALKAMRVGSKFLCDRGYNFQPNEDAWAFGNERLVSLLGHH
jgi:hypothetical protein